MENYNLWIEVDTQKIHTNIEKIKGAIDEDVRIMAIVKANAYGHGMVEVAHAVADTVNYFGVSTFCEGKLLRENGILTPILILGSILPSEFAEAIDSDLTLTISDMNYVNQLHEVSKKAGKKVKIHIKVDTGMGRWGLVYREAFTEIQEMCRFPFLDVEGVFTHFPVADNTLLDYTDRQIELFKALIDELEKENIHFSYIHAANSAGIVNFKESHFNLVRPGIMIYGYFPEEDLGGKIDVESVLSVKSRICLIKEFGPNRGVSYGRSFITEKRTRVGIIPIGYGHGYPYALSRKSAVLICGKRYNVAGSVCMDYLMIDLGDDSTVSVGDEVVVLGSSGEESITAYELAKKAHTIPYEIITSLTASIPRVYLNME